MNRQKVLKAQISDYEHKEFKSNAHEPYENSPLP